MPDAEAWFILYVADQRRSAEFYAAILDAPPELDVPGMTEFRLPGGARLGLMPEAGIRALLGERLPDPGRAAGLPRAELYLRVDGAERWLRRAVSAGAREISGVESRDWGDRAGYCLDPDGHVLAFAEPDV